MADAWFGILVLTVLAGWLAWTLPRFLRSDEDSINEWRRTRNALRRAVGR